MKGYKTEESRLVGIFKKGRDTWRDKALFRQEKIREMELTIRDKTRSRDKWKQRAKDAQKELAQKEALISKL